MFSCMIMHTREKLGKQANKEQVRISSHFSVQQYSIPRELSYIKTNKQKKAVEMCAIYLYNVTKKRAKLVMEKSHSKFPSHKRYISFSFSSFILLPVLKILFPTYLFFHVSPDMHFLL